MIHPAQQRARRAILAGLALFTLVQIALAPALLRYGLPLRDPGYGQKVRRLNQRLASNPRPLLAVGIGSSRTIFGLRGQVAEPWLRQRLGRPVVVFNMGLTGAGPITNLINLRRLLNEGIRPDLLLIEVLPRSLNEEESVAEVQPERLPASRLRYDEMRTLARLAQQQSVQRHWWLAQAVPAYAHRLSFLTCAAPTLTVPSRRWEMNPFEDSDDSGWVEMPALCAERAQRSLMEAKLDYQPALVAFRLSEAKVAVVRKTIQLAHNAGVTPALVLMPEGPTFRTWCPPAVWQQIHAAVERLSREGAAPLLDLRECVGEDGFFDSHHLYPAGAALFTRRLAEEIAPLLRPAE
jgi:hypothetical protein